MTDSDSPNTSVILVDTEGGNGSFSFQWNPHKTSMDVKIPWNQLRVAGREQPIQQFGCGEAQTLDIEFDLSRMNRGDGWVMSASKKLFNLKKPTVGGFIKRPPKCQLIFGKAFTFTCFVTNVHVDFGPLFHPTSLLPYNAKVKMSFREAK
jgi:hypothetical protein